MKVSGLSNKKNVFSVCIAWYKRERGSSVQAVQTQEKSFLLLL